MNGCVLRVNKNDKFDVFGVYWVSFDEYMIIFYIGRGLRWELWEFEVAFLYFGGGNVLLNYWTCGIEICVFEFERFRNYMWNFIYVLKC